MENIIEGLKITIIGMGTVLSILFFLSLILQLMGYFFKGENTNQQEVGERMSRHKLEQNANINRAQETIPAPGKALITEESLTPEDILTSEEILTSAEALNSEDDIEPIYAAVIAAAVYQVFNRREYKIISIKRKDNSPWSVSC